MGERWAKRLEIGKVTPSLGVLSLSKSPGCRKHAEQFKGSATHKHVHTSPPPLTRTTGEPFASLFFEDPQTVWAYGLSGGSESPSNSWHECVQVTLSLWGGVWRAGSGRGQPAQVKRGVTEAHANAGGPRPQACAQVGVTAWPQEEQLNP